MDGLAEGFFNMQIRAGAKEILQCNGLSSKFGLELTERQAADLLESRLQALHATGRVELGSGVLKELIYAFCDSPFLTQENYSETLAALQEDFYCLKNESNDEITDDELIDLMKTVFDGRAQGSLEYMAEISLADLDRTVRGEGKE